MTDHTSGVSRRSIAKGAAWAVPVLTLTTAPLMAASIVIDITAYSVACKLPGGSCEGEVGAKKGYLIRVNVCNSSTSAASITFDPATISLGGTPSSGWAIAPNPLTIAAGACKDVTLALENQPSSQNVSIDGSISYSFTAGTQTGTGAFSFSAPGTPPCSNCGL